MKRFHPHRVDQATRDRLAETHIGVGDFIQVFFLVEGQDILRPVPGLAGTAHVSTDRLSEAAAPFLRAGINRFLLFGLPEHATKDRFGSAATSPDALVPRGVQTLKAAHPEAVVMTDVCLCAYTDHGHCGILSGPTDGATRIDNDASLTRLAEMAIVHAQAGADWVAPSAMMDGQVEAIRLALDEGGFSNADQSPCRILGYSAKFASVLYGPFRGAADCSPQFGDRQSYQMDIRNGREALDEIDADLEEGADAVMVKPASTYLDVLARARDRFGPIKLAAYHTSGEFMALQAAARAGVYDYQRALREQLLAIKRAGADWIIGYAAADFLGLDLPWESTNRGQTNE